MILAVATVFTTYLFLHHFGLDMPFRGLLSEYADKAIDGVGFKEIVLSWLPAWWITLAATYTMTGFSIACALWGFFNVSNGLPFLPPVLLGLAALAGAVGNMIVPIVTAWMKYKSDVLDVNHLKERIAELEEKLSESSRTYEINRRNIERIADVTKKIVEVTPDVDEDVRLDHPEEKT